MNGKRPFIILGLAAVILLGLFIYFGKGGTARTFNWKENYKKGNDDPNGASVAYELLNGDKAYPVTDIVKSVKEDLPEDPDTLSNYIFIGPSLYLDSMDTQRLLTFVENGNNAFISSKTIPYDLMFYLNYEECEGAFWDDYGQFTDTLVTANFDHPDLLDSTAYTYKFIKKFSVEEYLWNYIDSSHFCGDASSLTALGSWKGTKGSPKVNFVKAKYGSGYFYLHSTPLMFSNLQMLDEHRSNYANKVFAHLPKGGLYWDVYGKQDENIGRKQNEAENESIASLSEKSPLQYILSQAPLAWAWYLMLVLAILFLFFRAKRRQRIIPVLHENKNTSLEFVSTIGGLYFQQKNHRNISLKQMQLFLNFVRNRFGISTKDLDSNFVSQLGQLSEVPQVEVENLFLVYKNIQKTHAISEDKLIEFNTLLEAFYAKCSS